MTLTVGVDIGGTKIAAAVVDENGHIVEAARAATPRAIDDIVMTTSGLVAELGSRHDIVAVGVACAAFIDAERSRVRFAPNIAWRDMPLREQLEQATGHPVVIENDANAAAWGEFVFGPAAHVDHMVLVTIGTGVGGGIVLDGRLMRGGFGIAGELGHIRMVPQGILCGCGNRGCWEVYASGNALVRDARELMASSPGLTKELLDRCGGDPARLEGPDITALAAEGDPASTELLATLGQWIGEGAASIASVLDPTMFVLGGGVAAAGDLLLDPAVAAYRRNLSGRGHRPEAEWALASLGNDAGVIGAAVLAREAAE